MGNKLLGVLGVAMVVASLAMGAFAFAWPNGAARMMGWGQAAGPAGASGSISMDDAQKAAQSVIDRYPGSDLGLDEIMEFRNNFYVLVKEKASGTGAFELLVDHQTGTVYPEPGPDMMWNTKYGMMSGPMMGGGQAAGPMTVTAEQASRLAQSWLDVNQKGNTVGTSDTFYGYYTFDFLAATGRPAGMLSVNGNMGQVWYHTWHGGFVAQKELGG